MLLALAFLATIQASLRSTISLNPLPIFTANNIIICNDPNGCRTLWHIIWSSLFTIFLCTWVSVHPNIPGPHEGWWRVTSRRLGIMLAVLIAPEVVFSWALRQRVLAHELANQNKCHGWTLTHGFFAIMGGYMAFDDNQEVQTLLPDQLKDYSLTGKDDFIRITEEEIKDKSKGDIISKGLVVLQVGWFVLQCIARWGKGLPITELELMAVAFAVISFAMFLLWWQKPLDVARAVRVYKKPGSDEPSGNDHAAENESPTVQPTVSCWVGFCRLVMLTPVSLIIDIAVGNPRIIEDEKRIATFYPETWSTDSEKSIVLGSAVAATVFGAIHCAAWQFEFPSKTERLLWRITSVAITSLPMIFVLLVTLFIRKPTYVYAVVLIIFLPVYAFCRMILLVLPFLCLRALSVDAYRSLYWGNTHSTPIFSWKL